MTERPKLLIAPVRGKCANCGRVVDSTRPRFRDPTIYVIGDKLACSKACAERLGYKP